MDIEIETHTVRCAGCGRYVPYDSSDDCCSCGYTYCGSCLPGSICDLCIDRDALAAEDW